MSASSLSCFSTFGLACTDVKSMDSLWLLLCDISAKTKECLWKKLTELVLPSKNISAQSENEGEQEHVWWSVVYLGSCIVMELERVVNVSLVSRPCPAFCRLHYFSFAHEDYVAWEWDYTNVKTLPWLHFPNNIREFSTIIVLTKYGGRNKSM